MSSARKQYVVSLVPRGFRNPYGESREELEQFLSKHQGKLVSGWVKVQGIPQEGEAIAWMSKEALEALKESDPAFVERVPIPENYLAISEREHTNYQCPTAPKGFETTL